MVKKKTKKERSLYERGGAPGPPAQGGLPVASAAASFFFCTEKYVVLLCCFARGFFNLSQMGKQSILASAQEEKGEADPLLDSVTRITSMCPNCEDNGETILFLHKVPHFKDLLISSFSCPHCNYSNREVSRAERGIQEIVTLNRCIHWLL